MQLNAPPEFMLVMSTNPGYQSMIKELKPSTRQRFLWLDFEYPPEEDEVAIVQESGCSRSLAKKGANRPRSPAARERALPEGLVYAAIGDRRQACQEWSGAFPGVRSGFCEGIE